MTSLVLLGGLLLSVSAQDQTPPPGRQPAEKKFSELRILVTDRDHKPVDLTLATGAIVVRPKSGPAKTMNLSIVVPETPPGMPEGASRAEVTSEGDYLLTAVLVPASAFEKPPGDQGKAEDRGPVRAPHAEPEKVKPRQALTSAYFKVEIETPGKDAEFSAEVTILLRDKTATARFEVPLRGREKSSTDESDPSKRVK